jgi:hypothetical protein
MIGPSAHKKKPLDTSGFFVLKESSQKDYFTPFLERRVPLVAP